MIPTAHLFRPLHQELIALLRGLSAEDWQKPTVAGAWRVKDVAAHLLDGMLRRLAAARDHYQEKPAESLDSPQALVALVDRLNADWVKATARLSPRQLIELLEKAGEELADYFAGLDPQGPAFWPVSWAGQDESRNWLDIGRDYTEGWHHQQQIRLATGRPLQLDRRFGQPALALFVLALPHTYRDVAAPPGTVVGVMITGEAGGSFTLKRGENTWQISGGAAAEPAARLEIRDADAWLLFTKGLKGEAARAAVRAEGKPELTEPFLRAVAIIG